MQQDQEVLLTERDDLPHEPGSSRSWRESAYFELCDQTTGLWCYVYVGERPNKGHAGMALSVRTGDGQLFGRLAQGPVDRDDRSHRCAGLELTTVEAMARHSITYAGPVVGPETGIDGTLRLDPAAMRPGAEAVRGAVELAVDLRFEATTPFYTFPTTLLLPFFAGHVQQMGRMHGTIRIDGKTHEVAAPSFRDRSWGDRDWFGISEYLFVFAPFENGAIASTRIITESHREVVGWTWDGTTASDVTAWDDEHIEFDASPGKRLPSRVRFDAVDEHGRAQAVDAELLSASPSVFEGRGPLEGKLSWIDRCTARFVRGDETVLGVIESQQVVDVPRGWS